MSESTVKQFTLEVLAVTMGVLLAFGLSTWNDSRVKNNLAESSLERIILEIKRNRDVMSDKASYYKAIAEECKNIVQSGSNNIALSQLSTFNGFNPPQLLTSAYETAIASQALSYMNVDKIEKISAVYKYQEWVVDDIQKYVFEYTFDKERPTRMLRMVLQEIITVSQFLVKDYNRAIGALTEKERQVEN